MIRRPEDAVDDKGRTIPAPHTVGEPLPQEPASSAPSVVVLDYGAGNVRSAVRALEEGVLTDIREGDVGAILGWVEQLAEVDVEGVEPLTGAAQMALRLRDDAVTDGSKPDAVLANAPDREGAYFGVPKVVE